MGELGDGVLDLGYYEPEDLAVIGAVVGREVVQRLPCQVQEEGCQGVCVSVNSGPVLRAIDRAHHLVYVEAHLLGHLDELLHLRDAHLLGGREDGRRCLLQHHHRQLGERHNRGTHNKFLCAQGLVVKVIVIKIVIIIIFTVLLFAFADLLFFDSFEFFDGIDDSRLPNGDCIGDSSLKSKAKQSKVNGMNKKIMRMKAK